MKSASFLAIRYFRKTNVGFINFTSVASIVGTMLGTTALIITLSILNGFRVEVTERLFDFQPHFRVEKSNFSLEESTEIIDNLKAQNVEKISTILERKAMIVSEKRETVVMVRAVENSILNVMKFEENWTGGHFNLSEKNGLSGIVLGWRLADELGVSPGLDSIITVISPLETRTGTEIPPSKKFVLRGIYQSSMFDFDRNFAYISIKEGHKLFRKKDEISAIIGMCENESDALKLTLNDSEISITTWRDDHADLFSAMQMEKWATAIVLALIIIVALFNLISALVMLVMEKTTEIGILRAMGAKRQDIRKIFLIRGLMSGISGVIFGLILGVGLVVSQLKFHWANLPGDGLYLIDYIPVNLQIWDVAIVAVITLLMVWIFSIVPANRAAKLDPVEAIHYE